MDVEAAEPGDRQVQPIVAVEVGEIEVTDAEAANLGLQDELERTVAVALEDLHGLGQRIERLGSNDEQVHGGVTAGIDLALALVERDQGRPSALDLARRLVVHSKRSGGQSQFSVRLRQQVESEAGSFDELHEWVASHLDADLRVERLAERVGQSPRTFHRTYTKELGQTPARMVALLRVDAARRMLEEGNEGVAAIALHCGFGTEEHLRRSFQRELGLPPSAYRARWADERSVPRP